MIAVNRHCPDNLRREHWSLNQLELFKKVGSGCPPPAGLACLLPH